MRGVMIENGVEVRLEAVGDGFVQGDQVVCHLSLKNRNSAPVSLPRIRLQLAEGTLKLVKAKDPKAFDLVAEAPLPSSQVLDPGAEITFSHSFTLTPNALVSEKNQSLFLLYGTQETLSAAGQLPLTVVPHRYLEEVFRTLEMVYSFVPKGVSWKDGYTCMKFSPPSVRELSLVEELVLGAKRDGEHLVLRYNFKVKKFDTAGTGIQVKKGKNEYEFVLTPDQYLFGGGHINQESLEGNINAALKEVSTTL